MIESKLELLAKRIVFEKRPVDQPEALIEAIGDNDAFIREMVEDTIGLRELAVQYIGAMRGRAVNNSPVRTAVVIRSFPTSHRSRNALQEARQVATLSVLQTFRLDGIPLGECTGAMCRAYVLRNKRNVAFINAVASQIPDDCMTVGKAFKGKAGERDIKNLYDQFFGKEAKVA